jgi:hypothetical protein
MPIFSYFLVVGSVLAGLLLLFGNESQPNGPHSGRSLFLIMKPGH